ncbi:unnamed protein product [Rotaria sp. Silwood1]|nr:unnamed protein product [Rotaria sp. Silwood1]
MIQEEIDLDIDEMKRHNHINESFATDPEFGRQNIRTKRELGHRDLWYDKLYGNSLKVDAHGNILTVVYGFKFLNNTRSHDAKTFLLIDSEYWYTDKLMIYLLATDSDTNNSKRDWKSHFNYIVVDAQKPLFFAEGTTLRRIDPNTGSMKLGSYSGQLLENEVYSGGK